MDQFNKNEQRLIAMIKTLDLDTLTWANKPVPDDEARALEQLNSRLLRLYGEVFTVFIKAYLKEFPPEQYMDKDEIETHIEKIMREKTHSVTRFLMRKYHAGEGAQSLADAARRIYKENSSFSKNKSDFIKAVEDAVVFLGVWHVERKFREVSPENRTEQTIRYYLSPGPVLLAFHKFIYVPYAAKAVTATQKVLKDNSDDTGEDA